MAQDTDPGIGVGFPVPYTPPVVGDVPAADMCVPFERTLEILNIDHKPGAYGQIGSQCEHIWTVYMREGWIDKVRMAADEIKRALGAPICPSPVYDELHKFKSRIKVRQAPVAYLGRHTFSDWTTEALTNESDDSGKYFELCDQDIAPLTINDVQFVYPDSVLECYAGLQTLQTPCIWRIEGTCGPGADDGYKISWPNHQLISPDTDEVQSTDDTHYITEIKWRTAAIDTDLAVEMVGECTCGCCDDLEDNLTATLQDATEGIVCINNCDPSMLCSCGNTYLRLNYGTAFSYGAGVSPSLEEAIVLLGLVKADRTPIKPCGCDNTWIDGMLEIDPTSANAFAAQLSYGPTVAGMRVMRIMDKFLARPHFNQEVMTGGLFSGNKTRKKRRRASYLRG